MKSQVTPALLEDFLNHENQHIDVKEDVIAFPHQWQVPAATEKAAYENVLLCQNTLLDAGYIGFPWATLVDAITKNSPIQWHLLDQLKRLQNHVKATNHRKLVTVCQHIHAYKFMILFNYLGITDLFWSHATIKLKLIEDIRIHAFPIFPAQVSSVDQLEDIQENRKYLANFIGAYQPGLYISDVRQHIFNDEGKMPDVLIVKRNSWHFNRAVYDEQIRAIKPTHVDLKREANYKHEFLQAIRDSVFTLCPTGSGPNSIRICEALALGSIPIILTKDLELPGDRKLWEEACVIEDDSEQGYRRALKKCREMNSETVMKKIKNMKILYQYISPMSYSRLIMDKLLE